MSLRPTSGSTASMTTLARRFIFTCRYSTTPGATRASLTMLDLASTRIRYSPALAATAMCSPGRMSPWYCWLMYTETGPDRIHGSGVRKM